MDEHLPQDLKNLKSDIVQTHNINISAGQQLWMLEAVAEGLLAIAIRLDRIANVVEDRGYAHLDGEGGDSLARLRELNLP